MGNNPLVKDPRVETDGVPERLELGDKGSGLALGDAALEVAVADLAVEPSGRERVPAHHDDRVLDRSHRPAVSAAGRRRWYWARAWTRRSLSRVRPGVAPWPRTLARDRERRRLRHARTGERWAALAADAALSDEQLETAWAEDAEVLNAALSTLAEERES